MARRKAPEGFGRLAAVLAASDDSAPRIESRLLHLTVTTRWLTIGAGIVFGALHHSHKHFVVAAVALTAFAVVQTFRRIQPASAVRAQLLVLLELAFTVGATYVTGGLSSPFVLTPVTGLLLAGYVWGERATIGTAVAGAIAASATILLQTADTADHRSAGQLAIVYLLCGALGAFTRNLVSEIESHRAAALDQAAEMATANDLLVSLHALAQTLPASFDLGEVVDSMRQRLRSLVRFSSLVVLVRDDAQSAWTVELAEGVRLPARIPEHELPGPLRRALRSVRPVLIEDRLIHTEEDGFSALARSGLYMALRARGTIVGLIAVEDVEPDVYGTEQGDVVDNLSSLLALSIDNARWFARLRTLGAEAERARIARELHDRIAQSLAYVAFELERIDSMGGGRDHEIAELRDVVREIVRELRETIYQLRAHVSEREGILVVAEEYLERFGERTGITAHWMPAASTSLPFRIEQEMWRIAQEALVNVERHSKASSVVVRWEVVERNARLEVIDNGEGFEPDRVSGEHYGLVGMRERADAVGAHLMVESSPGRGTRVAVDLPLTTAVVTERRSA